MKCIAIDNLIIKNIIKNIIIKYGYKLHGYRPLNNKNINMLSKIFCKFVDYGFLLCEYDELLFYFNNLVDMNIPITKFDDMLDELIIELYSLAYTVRKESV